MNLPQVGTGFSLEDAGGALFAGRVLSEMARCVVIEWDGDDTPAAGECTIHWVSDRGLLVMTCTLQVIQRYGRLEAVTDPELLQRRQAVRVELMLPVHLLSQDRAPGKLLYTRNVSETGLLLAGQVSLGVDEPCWLQLDLPDQSDEPVEVAGRVCRSETDGLLAIELVDLTPAQQKRLVNVVFEQQRAALRERSTRQPRLRLVGKGI